MTEIPWGRKYKGNTHQSRYNEKISKIKEKNKEKTRSSRTCKVIVFPLSFEGLILYLYIHCEFSFLLAAAGFCVTQLRQMTYKSFKGWGASLPSGFCSVLCWEVWCRDLTWHQVPSLGFGRCPKHTRACSAAQGELCCVPGITAARVWCSQVSALQRHNSDCWNTTGWTDLSYRYIMARHLRKPSARSSCISLMVLIILFQAWSLCLEVRNAFHCGVNSQS